MNCVRKLLLLTLVLLLLGVCLTSSASAADALSLKCINQSALQQIEQQPQHVQALYRRCWPQMQAKLPASFAGLDKSSSKFAFASLVAFRLAGYGQSVAYDLPYLLRQPGLDCAGYTALTWHLARVAGADVRYAEVIGWDGGGVGNHAMLAYNAPGYQLLLDPTTATIARADIAAVLAGQAVASESIVTFPKRNDEMTALRDMVISSLYLGTLQQAYSTYRQQYPPGQGISYQQALSKLTQSS